jgi:tRNA (guanine10-N2)-methyltransferase
MANSALLRPGLVALDPCVGTGAILVAAAHHGAMCIGADINQKLLTGRTRAGTATVRDNFVQYGFAPPDILCADLSHGTAFRRRGEWIDAVICDPPYGVRAGARKLGRAPHDNIGSKRLKGVDGSAASAAAASAPVDASGAAPADESNPAYLATQLYEVEQVVHDLLSLAGDVLRVGGRLCYWLPTPGDDGTGVASAPGSSLVRPPPVVPTHPCLRVVSVCRQSVRLAFSRCLVTMEKVRNNNDQLRAEYAALQTQQLAAESDTGRHASLSASVTASAATTGDGGPLASPVCISAKHAKRLAKVAFRQQRKAQQQQQQTQGQNQ